MVSYQGTCPTKNGRTKLQRIENKNTILSIDELCRTEELWEILGKILNWTFRTGIVLCYDLKHFVIIIWGVLVLIKLHFFYKCILQVTWPVTLNFISQFFGILCWLTFCLLPGFSFGLGPDLNTFFIFPNLASWYWDPVAVNPKSPTKLCTRC